MTTYHMIANVKVKLHELEKEIQKLEDYIVNGEN